MSNSLGSNVPGWIREGHHGAEAKQYRGNAPPVCGSPVCEVEAHKDEPPTTVALNAKST